MKIWVLLLFLFVSYQSQAKNQFLEMSPPKAKLAQKNQLPRMDDIKAYKRSGFIGEADTGFLAIQDIKKIPQEKLKKISDLLESENKDRKVIYEEIIKYNKLKEPEATLFYKSVFETNKNADPVGTFYLEKSTWFKKY